MSCEYAIRVDGLSKCYHIYDKPYQRLLQMFFRGRRQLYREFWALQELSFEVRRGEAVGIIGRNGSGKSTLLQLICGTLNPTSGSVSTNGRIAALLELGSGFNPEFSGRENVYMNGAVLGLTHDEVAARFADIEAFADIGDFIDQPTKTYSSGMMVRLAFAVQVCVDPDILVVDEALAVGDALFQKRCFERMEQLRSKGTTLLFVSHDQESVRTLTDRAIFLHQGKVRGVGTSAEVLLDYRRFLHEEENRALNASAARLRQRAVEARETQSAAKSAPASRSASLSFGDLEAEVVGVEVFDREGQACSHFDPRDPVRIVVHCVMHKALDQLNVSLRIRNKEGVKIYSWGTLNQDIAILAGLQSGEVFWERSFTAGERISVVFEFECGLGSNLYEVQAAITHEGKPYYAEQRILHWMDEAAFFTSMVNTREYHFGGVVDMRMHARALEGHS